MKRRLAADQRFSKIRGPICSLKLGDMRALIIGGVVRAAAIVAYATLAFAGTSIPLFALVMAGDNFGISFAGVVLVAYMSSLTNLGYTATRSCPSSFTSQRKMATLRIPGNGGFHSAPALKFSSPSIFLWLLKAALITPRARLLHSTMVGCVNSPSRHKLERDASFSAVPFYGHSSHM